MGAYESLKPFIARSTTIKCHRCGTTKGESDKGIFGAWLFGETHKSIVWFHNLECLNKWETVYPENKMKQLNDGFAGDTGLISLKTETPFNDDDEI